MLYSIIDNFLCCTVGIGNTTWQINKILDIRHLFVFLWWIVSLFVCCFNDDVINEIFCSGCWCKVWLIFYVVWSQQKICTIQYRKQAIWLAIWQYMLLRWMLNFNLCFKPTYRYIRLISNKNCNLWWQCDTVTGCNCHRILYISTFYCWYIHAYSCINNCVLFFFILITIQFVRYKQLTPNKIHSMMWLQRNRITFNTHFYINDIFEFYHNVDHACTLQIEWWLI